MATEQTLERELSEPTDVSIAALGRLRGDIIVLGAGGKMGPSLVRLALRSSRTAGISRRVIAVSRFEGANPRSALEEEGAETLARDLLDPATIADLPDASNVIFMVGQKFGTERDAARTWALNAFIPGLVAERYRGSRIAVFSTGNVYPFWPATTAGPAESDPLGPVGEYAQSVVGRERIFEFFSLSHATRVSILRVNYAIEPRYGVLRDIGDRVRAGQAVDLAMGRVNVIWQRDANAIALASLEHASAPPFVLNVTGPAVSVRAIAEGFGRRWSVTPRFQGAEAADALLSNPGRALELFGPLPTGLDSMIDRVADWIDAGGSSLGKPTHFEQRAGRF